MSERATTVTLPGGDLAGMPVAASAEHRERDELQPRVATTATRTRGARIPSLDGLRAISVAAVLIGHLTGTRGFPWAAGTWTESRFVGAANLGVHVFFVISGFLITHLLLEERRRTGEISLARFYTRRTARIFPAYVAFAVTAVLLDRFGLISVPRSDFVHVFSYTTNYDPHPAWQVGHLWSLAIEEQFYLLWPLALVVAGAARGTRVVFAVICVAPLIRMGEMVIGRAGFLDLELIGHSFETAADALAAGCLLALARDALWNRSWYHRVVVSRWIAPGLLVAGVVLSGFWTVRIALGQTIVSVAVALMIDRLVRHPDGVPGRLLNSAPFVLVGTLSYSLYIWQMFFLNRHSTALLASFPLNIELAVGCATLSYYCIERPCINARPRLERALFGRSRAAAVARPG